MVNAEGMQALTAAILSSQQTPISAVKQESKQIYSASTQKAFSVRNEDFIKLMSSNPELFGSNWMGLNNVNTLANLSLVGLFVGCGVNLCKTPMDGRIIAAILVAECSPFNDVF